MDRLTSMAVFVTVVERGSLTRAADAHGMSRAMVTRHLAELESWLDARLLHRTTRRLALTAAGEVAVDRCRAMLALGEDLQSALCSDDATPRGRLRLTCSTSFGISVLAALVAEYTARYPQTAIDLLQVDRTVNLVEERMDLAIRIASRLDPGLIGRRLSVCRSVLCASPGYLARAGAPIVPADLGTHACLTHHFVGNTLWQLRRGDACEAVAVGGSFSANDATSLQQGARVGAGIAMLPTYLVGDDLRVGALVRVLPDWNVPDMGIHAVYQSRRHMPSILRSFVDFLAVRFGDAPAWDHGLFRQAAEKPGD